jgi:hypothetical protein
VKEDKDHLPKLFSRLPAAIIDIINIIIVYYDIREAAVIPLPLSGLAADPFKIVYNVYHT